MAQHYSLGTLKLALVDDGSFRLDGGAMFGVVPKVLWQRHKVADERNRIHMASHSLLVERGDDLLIVDTGLGDKHDARFYDQMGMEPAARRLPEALRSAGYEPEDVTHVLSTHLHFDHCGWHTELRDGELRPTFPRARYWLCRGEVEHARAPNARDRASYDSRNWEPLFASGVVELFETEAEPVPGVRAVVAEGHNEHMCIVLLDGAEQPFADPESGQHRAVFWADLVPTVAHLPYAWVMSYDLFPLRTMANKELWLPQAAEQEWLCFFQHEVEAPVGRLVETRPGRYQAEPVAFPGDGVEGKSA